MQAAYDVELGDRFGVAGSCRLPGLFEGHGVTCCVALGAAEGAETAVGYANVSGVNMPVDVEVGDVAMHPLAHVVGQPAYGQNVAGIVERHAIVEAQPLAGEDLLRNRLDARVVGTKTVPCRIYRCLHSQPCLGSNKPISKMIMETPSTVQRFAAQ